MKLTSEQRNAARDDLLGHINQLRQLLDARRASMMAAALGTGCTSLVNTVRGIETTLNLAYKKVQKS
jgi:hypothetical protein